jgi:hypothetical protein
MSLRIASTAAFSDWRRIWYAFAAIVVASFIAMLSSAPGWLLVLAGIIAYLLFAVKSIQEPLFFGVTFLLLMETIPPLFFDQTGDTPVYLSFLLIPVGSAILIFRYRDLQLGKDPVGSGLVTFLAATAFSLPFAWWFSGVTVGAGSLSRWLLLAHTAFIYYLIRGGARFEITGCERWVFRLMLGAATLSAAYGIIDFVWPVPFPHPAADQFIWLGNVVLRRAQGVFYESSNFANFCGFFLVITSGALMTRKERLIGGARPALFLLVVIFSVAVVVAFSRSTWASVLVALFVFASVTGHVKACRAAAIFLALAAPFLVLWKFSPELWAYLLDARVGRLADIFADPNAATSGRFDTWMRVISIMGDNPRYLLFGIGYKSLAFTRLFHKEIIVDNGYLSLLLETGITGLAGFLVFSGKLLNTFRCLSRTRDEALTFWSAALLSIWCGQLVQLLAVDTYTYWRNMAVFAALAAFTLNRAERTGSLQFNSEARSSRDTRQRRHA